MIKDEQRAFKELMKTSCETTNRIIQQISCERVFQDRKQNIIT